MYGSVENLAKPEVDPLVGSLEYDIIRWGPPPPAAEPADPPAPAAPGARWTPAIAAGGRFGRPKVSCTMGSLAHL